MPTISNVVCVTCQLEMLPVKTGDIVEELQSSYEPYKVWSCDRFGCRQCGVEVLVNFGPRPIAEHFQAWYQKWHERASLRFGGGTP